MSIDITLLCIYFMLLPINTALSGVVGNISLLNYIALLYLLARGMQILNNKTFFIQKKYGLIYLYFFYVAISFFWNPHFSVNWYFTTTLTSAMLVFFITTRIYGEYELSYIIISIFISLIVTVVIFLYNINNTVVGRIQIHVFSTMDPNDFGCGLSLITALILTKITQTKKYIWVFFLVLPFAMIVFTGSRGALMVFFSQIMMWMLFDRSKNLSRTVVLTIVCLLILIFFKKYLPSELVNRFSLSLLKITQGAGRLNIWKSALNVFVNSRLDHVIFGHGHGSFPYAVNYIAPGNNFAYEAHNMYINELIEGGIFGLVLFIFALIQAIKNIRNCGNVFGLLVIIALLVEGLTVDVQAFRIFAVPFIFAIIINDENINYLKSFYSNPI